MYEVLRSIWSDDERYQMSNDMRRHEIIDHIAMIQTKKKMHVSPLIDLAHAHGDGLHGGNGNGVKRKDVSSQHHDQYNGNQSKSAAKKAKADVSSSSAMGESKTTDNYTTKNQMMPMVAMGGNYPSNGSAIDDNRNCRGTSMDQSQWRYDSVCTWSMNNDYRQTLSIARYYLTHHQLSIVHTIASSRRTIHISLSIIRLYTIRMVVSCRQ